MLRLPDLIRLSTRVFTTRPLRSFLTVLGVSIGIGAVLFLVSLGYGLQEVILKQITTTDALLSLDVTTGSSAAIVLDDSRVASFRELPNVTETARLKSFTGTIAQSELTADSVVRAVDPLFFRLNGTALLTGEVFTNDTDQSIVISAATAKLYNLDPTSALDRKVRVTVYVQSTAEDGTEEVTVVELPQEFTVIGVTDDEQASNAFIPLRFVIGATTIQSYDLVKVKVSDQAAAPAVRDAIIERGFLASALSDVIDQARSIFRIVQIVLGLFGLIALVVSAIGMFNTMTIALLERINDIGIMRSIGITRGDVRAMFLIESMLMGLLGGLGGVIVGTVAGELANYGINFLAKNFGGKSLDLFIQPVWFIIVIISFSVVIGFLTGIFPSRRAANMDPLEALRYK